MTCTRSLLCGRSYPRTQGRIDTHGPYGALVFKRKMDFVGAVEHFWCAECPTGILNGYIFAPAGIKERLPHVRTRTTHTTQNLQLSLQTYKAMRSTNIRAKTEIYI